MRLAIPLLVLFAVPAAGSAQERPDRFDGASLLGAPTAIPTRPAAPIPAAERPAAPVAAAAELAPQEGRSFLSSVLHTVGGAVVGGWVGYVGSQVTLSDWEKETNSSFSGTRTAWVAGGMVVGILGSRLIGRTYAPGVPTPEVRQPRSSRDVLTRAEIEGSGATSVYDLISSSRKQWLVPRGTHSFDETARGSGAGVGPGARLATTPGQAAVVVYMDEVRIGEIERMREILINDIMEIRFIPPQEASYRYGSGHSHGVILLKTVR